MQIKPFFINSNICLNNDDISTFERFMKTTAKNTGNSYITYALIKEIFGEFTNEINHIPNIYEYNFDNTDKDVEFINSQCSHIFLILQDQIRIEESYGLKLPYDNIMQFIKKLNKPVIIAGLGANSFNGYDKDFHLKIDKHLVRFLKFLSQHCICMGVRGHYTAEVLSKLGILNVNVIGCPSFYENGKDRIIQKQELSSEKSVCLSTYNIFETSKCYSVMQDLQEENLIKLIAYNRYEGKFTERQLDNIYNEKYMIFSNIEEWKNFIRHFRFVIGSRVHGSILALNSGVLALCTNSDSRASEMCDLMKIPHIKDVKINDFKDILNIYQNIDCSPINSSYPKLYANFQAFMADNGVEVKQGGGIVNLSLQPSLNLYHKTIFSHLTYVMSLENSIEKMMQVRPSSLKKIKNKIRKILNVYS